MTATSIKYFVNIKEIKKYYPEFLCTASISVKKCYPEFISEKDCA